MKSLLAPQSALFGDCRSAAMIDSEWPNEEPGCEETPSELEEEEEIPLELADEDWDLFSAGDYEPEPELGDFFFDADCD